MENRKLQLTVSIGNATHLFFSTFSKCVYRSFRKGHFMGSVQLSSVLQSVKKYTIIFVFTIKKRKPKNENRCVSTVNFGRFFHSTAFSSSEWNSIFQNFQKRGQPREVYPNFRKFSFHSTLLPKFLELLAKWFALRKLDSFRNFWKLFGEISVPFAVVSKFSKVSG